MINHLRIYLLLVFSFICYLSSEGQIILDEKTLNNSVAYQATILEDKNHEFKLESIIKTDSFDFKPLNKPIEIIDFNSSRWFIRFYVKNTGVEKNIMLETARPITNRVDLFEVQKGQVVQTWKSGDNRVFDQKTYPHRKNIFPMKFKPNEVKKFYLILESDGEVINLPLTFWEQKVFYKTDYKNQFLHGFYFGMLGLVVFIFFFFYLLLKEVSFLYYILYVLFQLLLQFSLEGYSFQYIFPNQPHWANLSVLLSAAGTVFFVILYAKSFLEIPTRLKIWNKYFNGILFGLGIILIATLIPGRTQELSYPVINVLSLIGTVSIVWVIFLLKSKGYKISNAFTVGFILLILGAVIFILGNLGIFGDALISELSLKFSSGLEILALSISMAERYKVLQEEKEKAQEEALKNLEEIVAERTKKVNDQKLKIEEQHKDMVSSIEYAKRIQSAILPKNENIIEVLNDHFILYQPRDIVSGDFYFIERITTNKGENIELFSAIDCTGHGVPGAFMSFLGNSLLTQSTSNPDVNTPAEALHFLNEGILSALRIKESNKEGEPIRDGMDMTLCGLNREKSELYFAGAKNSILIVTNAEREINFDFSSEFIKGPVYNKDKSRILVEIKGDRHPIGLYGKFSTKAFTNHVIPVIKGDIIYSYSDGYIDQFGGPKNKKYGTKQFKELILNVSHHSMSKQKEILEKEFIDWKKGLESLDDVIVMGVKV